MLHRLWLLLVAAALVVATTCDAASLEVGTVEVGEQLGELDEGLVEVLAVELPAVAAHALPSPPGHAIPAAPPLASIFRPPRTPS